ncbi:hypothetical protein HHI36_022495 [Cryptolaemus montrouzieri]|uniref:Uncharacterized protein n=1 Tax=Cryptolaemus montrouzieri TaxID=559131 RepID=A0ABD2N016_9CUCU
MLRITYLSVDCFIWEWVLPFGDDDLEEDWEAEGVEEDSAGIGDIVPVVEALEEVDGLLERVTILKFSSMEVGRLFFGEVGLIDGKVLEFAEGIVILGILEEGAAGGFDPPALFLGFVIQKKVSDCVL